MSRRTGRRRGSDASSSLPNKRQRKQVDRYLPGGKPASERQIARAIEEAEDSSDDDISQVTSTQRTLQSRRSTWHPQADTPVYSQAGNTEADLKRIFDFEEEEKGKPSKKKNKKQKLRQETRQEKREETAVPSKRKPAQAIPLSRRYGGHTQSKAYDIILDDIDLVQEDKYDTTICRCDGEWIAASGEKDAFCQAEQCASGWYHYDCLNGLEQSKYSTDSDVNWICRDCFEWQAQLMWSTADTRASHDDWAMGIDPPRIERVEATHMPRRGQGDRMTPGTTDKEHQDYLSTTLADMIAWTGCSCQIKSNSSGQAVLMYGRRPEDLIHTGPSQEHIDSDAQVIYNPTLSSKSGDPVAFPLRELCSVSQPMAEEMRADDEDDQIMGSIGPVNLKVLDNRALQLAKSFIHGKALIVGAKDRFATKISNNTMTNLVQLSLFAYDMSIKQLQLATMHALWKFFIIHQENVILNELDRLLQMASLLPGAPARELLFFVRSQVYREAPPPKDFDATKLSLQAVLANIAANRFFPTQEELNALTIGGYPAEVTQPAASETPKDLAGDEHADAQRHTEPKVEGSVTASRAAAEGKTLDIAKYLPEYADI